MSVWPLPRITFQELGAIRETRPVALLTTDEVWTVLSSQLTLPVLIQAEPTRYSQELFDYLAKNLPSQVEAVYVVGQGAPLQAGKVIAAHNHLPLIIVPTALDSDMALTPSALVQVEEDGDSRLTTIETGPASEVIIDWHIIEAAPEAARGAGIVDILSIVTGLLDWRHAAQLGKNRPGQRFTPWAASVAAGLASQAIKSAEAIGQGNRDALHTLLSLMMMSVQLSNQLGHARVREGGEHYLASILAGEAGSVLPHSQLVGPSILFLSALHGQSPDALREAMEQAGVRLDLLRTTDLRLALDHLPEHLVAYDFPYSMLNDIEAGSMDVIAALEAAGLAVAAQTWAVPDDTQPALATEMDASLLDEAAPAEDDQAAADAENDAVDDAEDDEAAEDVALDLDDDDALDLLDDDDLEDADLDDDEFRSLNG